MDRIHVVDPDLHRMAEAGAPSRVQRESVVTSATPSNVIWARWWKTRRRFRKPKARTSQSAASSGSG
jgi:hypothetical protein